MADTSLVQKVEQLFERLDAMDLEGIGAMLAEDAQSVDEITRGWTRGRPAIEGYFSQVQDVISDVHSRLSDTQERLWDGVGLVTFVLDQSYTMDGQQQTVSAPTSILFTRPEGEWKISLIHTVPIPEAE